MSSNPPKTEQPPENPTVDRNLYSESWTTVQWDSQQALNSLDRIRKRVEYEAVKAIHWYYEKKRNKVWYSQLLRMLAVIFGGIGAGIPFIASTGLWIMRDAAGGVPDVEILRINQWGYVFILGAGTCVALDKLFGFSTNWIRFVDAATKIETLLGRFRIEWYKQMALADIGAHPGDAVTKLFDTLLDFTAKTRDVIEKETGDWIAEFRSNLTKLAEDTKAAQEAREQKIQGQVDQIKQLAKEREQKAGAITVTITNFAALGAGFTWSLELDNELHKADIDRPMFIVKGLDPGAYLVSARGASNAKVVQAAQAVPVETGKPAAANLELK